MSDDHLTLIPYLFRYSRRSGRVHWQKHTSRGAPVHQSRQPNNLYLIRVGNQHYPVQDIVWLLVHGSWPESPLRHLNGRWWDNRIENLALSGPPADRIPRFLLHRPTGE